MKRKLNWNVIFGIFIVVFTIYSALYTFVIPTAEVTNATDMDLSMFDDEDDEPVGGSTSQNYFTSEVVLTDNSYSDENIYIKIETIRLTEDKTTVYVADIRLNSAQYLKTAFANDTYGRNQKANTSAIAKAHNAILAINGDYYGARQRGYVIRNGKIYRETKSTDTSPDVLGIKAEGTLKSYNQNAYTAQQILDDKVWQAFSFGPTLINEGEIIIGIDAEVNQSSAKGNPRTAIGIIEPKHYVFVVSDGRTTESTGLSLYQLATFMKGYGVKLAYNLDGGGSSSMVFNNKVVNQPTSDGKTIKERGVTDIVYIGY